MELLTPIRLRLRFALAVLFTILGACALTTTASAQTDVTTSRVSGTVVDGKGSSLPGVTIEARNEETGLKLGSVTDERGFFRILDLPTGLYTISASLDGFVTSDLKNLRVLLGTTPTVNFTLQSSAVAENITVTSEAPVVEQTNTTFSTTIQQEQIKNLPVSGRDFKNLTTLAPETTIETQRGNIAIGGERGINTSITVDGVDYNNSFFGGTTGTAEGRAPLSISQESIKELSVITNGASVEFGRAGGGFVNVITKNGTNSLHGSGFYYNQPQSLISDFSNGTSPRDQKKDEYGASLGGPIVQDRLFFFFSYDKQKQDVTVPIDTVLLNPAIFAKYPELTSSPDYVQTRDGSVFFGRLDAQITDGQRVLVRGNNPKYDGDNGTNSGTNVSSTYNGIEGMDAKVYVGSWTGQFGANALNDLNLNYVKEETPRDDKGQPLPSIFINSPSLSYGEVSFLPITSTVKRKAVGDTFTYLLGDHVLKGGGEYNDTSIDQIFKGNWRGVFVFNNTDDLLAGRWFQYRQFGGLNGLTADEAGRAAMGQKETGLFAQDQWFAMPNLTVTLGVRWEKLNNPDFPILNPNDRNANGTFKLNGTIPDAENQISPRLSIAWAPDTKSAVRFSAGRYWSRTPALLFAQAKTSNGVQGTQYTITAPTDAQGHVIGAPSDPLSPVWGSGWSATGIQRIDLSHVTKLPAPQVFTFSSNFSDPYSDRVTLGFEREIFAKTALSLDIVYAEDKNLERLTDINRQYDGTTSVNGLPHVSRTRPDPAYGQVIEYVSDAKSKYLAATATLRRRFSDSFSAYAAVTFSRDKDNDSNERNFSGIFAEDVNDIGLNYGYSDRDIKWKAILNGVWETPWWGIGLAGGLRFYTGLPYTPLVGSDVNGDGINTDRPTVGGDHFERNSFRQPSTYSLDLRLSKAFDIGPGQITPLVECFNCTNAANSFVTSSAQVYGLGPAPKSGFDQAKGVSNNPRTIQVALRYDF